MKAWVRTADFFAILNEVGFYKKGPEMDLHFCGLTATEDNRLRRSEIQIRGPQMYAYDETGDKIFQAHVRSGEGSQFTRQIEILGYVGGIRTKIEIYPSEAVDFLFSKRHEVPEEPAQAAEEEKPEQEGQEPPAKDRTPEQRKTRTSRVSMTTREAFRGRQWASLRTLESRVRQMRPEITQEQIVRALERMTFEGEVERYPPVVKGRRPDLAACEWRLTEAAE